MRAISDSRLELLHGRRRRAIRGARVIKIVLRDVVLGCQIGRPLGQHFCVGGARFGGGEIGELRIQSGLQRIGIDEEQRLSLLHIRAFGIDALQEHARDARARPTVLSGRACRRDRG